MMGTMPRQRFSQSFRMVSGSRSRRMGRARRPAVVQGACLTAQREALSAEHGAASEKAPELADDPITFRVPTELEMLETADASRCRTV